MWESRKAPSSSKRAASDFFFFFCDPIFSFFFFLFRHIFKKSIKISKLSRGSRFWCQWHPGTVPYRFRQLQKFPRGVSPSPAPPIRRGGGRTGDTARARWGGESPSSPDPFSRSERKNYFKNLPKIGVGEKKHKSHMKTKRGVWSFQPRGFGSGKVPPKGDPKGQMMGGGARARQASLRGSGPAAAPPEVSGRRGGSPPARASRQPPARPGGPGRSGGVHFRAPSCKGGGKTGSAPPSRVACNATWRKKARPHRCIRGHEILAGQNAGATGHPPSLALPRAQLLFPENPQSQALPAARRRRRLFFAF